MVAYLDYKMVYKFRKYIYIIICCYLFIIFIYYVTYYNYINTIIYRTFIYLIDVINILQSANQVCARKHSAPVH